MPQHREGRENMKLQNKASFKKEIMAFFRTKKLTIIALVFIGLAIFGPLMIRGLGLLMSSMEELYDDLGMDVTETAAMLAESATMGVHTFIENIPTVGLLVYLLLINSFAGGEQKRRSIIIPSSSGLRPFSYIFPKFIIYPLTALVLSIIAALVSAVISIAAFENNDIVFGQVLIAGTLAGVHLMLFICFHLALGTATGKAGMSAAVCICASFLVPRFFGVMSAGIDGHLIAYNPFMFGLAALHALYGDIAPSADGGVMTVAEVIISVAFALAIMVIVYFLAFFAQNVKKIDNTGNEMVI
jgi:ABC-2 type transport system permease protein